MKVFEHEYMGKLNVKALISFIEALIPFAEALI